MNTVGVLFEDDLVVAVSKPAGMIVNNADTSRDAFTLQDWVEDYRGNVFSGNTDYDARAGIVHRLDKETSGVILIAKNEMAFQSLQSQFKNRLVKKVYEALVHGRIAGEGSVSVPIGRLPWNKKRFGVSPNGREATTEFVPVSYFRDPDDKQDELTLIRLFPKTGRTHQIRVHMQYLGHAVYADPFYAGRKTARRDRGRLPRHFLHAREITFSHPLSSDSLTIEAPLTPELSDFLKDCEKSE